MNIFCSKCGSFFKNWRLDIVECCGKPMSILSEPKLGGVKPTKLVHYIQPDIHPYQAMAHDHTGKAPMITSRKEHREFLKRNGYQEIGNEMPKATRQQADHNVRHELTQATREVLAKYR